MDEFHNHINSINEKIQFTYEVENNKSIAYHALKDNKIIRSNLLYIENHPTQDDY